LYPELPFLSSNGIARTRCLRFSPLAIPHWGTPFQLTMFRLEALFRRNRENGLGQSVLGNKRFAAVLYRTSAK
jgi:hypothetical protein